MTHVILINSITEEEAHIKFPTQVEYLAYIKAVRNLVPNRNWEIFESWEAAA
jgi:hypothetical protein